MYRFPTMKGFSRRSNGFLSDRAGSVSVENAIWFPFMFAVLIFAADVAMTMQTNARMWDVARHVARLVATGQVTASEAVALSRQKLGSDMNVLIDETVIDEVTVRITSGQVGLSFGKLFDLFDAPELSTEYTMRDERA